MRKDNIQFQKGSSLYCFSQESGSNELCQKQLSRYFGEYYYRFNNRFHLVSVVDSIIELAVKTKPIPRERLKLVEDRW